MLLDSFSFFHHNNCVLKSISDANRLSVAKARWLCTSSDAQFIESKRIEERNHAIASHVALRAFAYQFLATKGLPTSVVDHLKFHRHAHRRYLESPHNDCCRNSRNAFLVRLQQCLPIVVKFSEFSRYCSSLWSTPNQEIERRSTETVCTDRFLENNMPSSPQEPSDTNSVVNNSRFQLLHSNFFQNQSLTIIILCVCRCCCTNWISMNSRTIESFQ